jgi:DNA repair exonuclease SbcCD nuclease subunit
MHFSSNRLGHKVRAFEKCLAKIDELQQETDCDGMECAILAGDIFDHSLRLEDPAAKEALGLITELNRRMPVLMIKGNHSHDRASVELFDSLPRSWDLITSSRPECVEFDPGGTLRKVEIDELALKKRDENGAECTFITLPYPSYSFVAEVQSLPAEGLRAAVSERITAVIKMFRLIETKSKILVYHGTVTGAQLSESHRMVGLDIELSPYDIKDSGFDFVAGGHIHFAQVMEEAPVFYPGGLAYSTYADHGKRGMWIHERRDIYWNHDFFDVEAPTMRTFEIDLKEGQHITLPGWRNEAMDLKVRLSYREDQNIDLDREKQKLLKWFPNATSLLLDKDMQRIGSIRAESVQEAKTLREKIQAWAAYAQVEITDSLLDKADLVEANDLEQLMEKAI